MSTAEPPSKASVNGACTAQTCNVDPETAVNIELGGKWDVNSRLALTAAVFRNDREEFKVADPLNPDNPSGEQQLDGQARVDGVTLGAAGMITDAWSVFANVTYLDSEVLQGISDFDRDRGAFTQSFGDAALDASLLLAPLVGFLPPEDERVIGTVRAIERELVEDGLVLRYRTGETDDGLTPGEGAFLACSFWLADNLAMQGRVAEARELFDRLLSLRNDLGLLAEQYDPRAKRQVGNFPQAFSHVALVNTAANLSRILKPAEQRADHAARAPQPA